MLMGTAPEKMCSQSDSGLKDKMGLVKPCEQICLLVSVLCDQIYWLKFHIENITRFFIAINALSIRSFISHDG